MNSCIQSTYSSLDLGTDLGPAKSLQIISEPKFTVECLVPRAHQNARKKPTKSHNEHSNLLLTKYTHAFGACNTLYDRRGSDSTKYERNQIHSMKNRALLSCQWSEQYVVWEWENRLVNHAVSSQFVGTSQGSSKQGNKMADGERSKSRTSRFRSIVIVLHIFLSHFRYLAVYTYMRSQQHLSYKTPLVLFLSLLKSDRTPHSSNMVDI